MKQNNFEENLIPYTQIDFSYDDLEIVEVMDSFYYELGVALHTLFINKHGDYFIQLYRETNDKTLVDRFMFFRIKEKQIDEYYRQKKISLYDVIMNNPDGYVYFIDVSYDIEVIHDVVRVDVKDVPDIYMPTKNSFYEWIPDGYFSYEEYAMHYDLKKMNESFLEFIKNLSRLTKSSMIRLIQWFKYLEVNRHDN